MGTSNVKDSHTCCWSERKTTFSRGSNSADQVPPDHKLKVVDEKPDGEPYSKWKDAKKWHGPVLHYDIIGEEEIHIRTGCAYMEGRRYWPDGDGVVPKYPNGCQDRCFAAKVHKTENTIVLGLFDGSGGENCEKVASEASCHIRQALVTHEVPLENLEVWKTFLVDTFQTADRAILRKPVGLWEDTAGSTGVISVIDSAHNKAIIAHVGDSRAMHFKRGYVFPDWQTNDHENTERSLGDRFRKLEEEGKKPVATPDIHEINDFAAGSAMVLVSDGILNAFPTPDEAITMIGGKLDKATKNVAAKNLAATILEAAEFAAFDNHDDIQGFQRDDMSICLLLVE